MTPFQCAPAPPTPVPGRNEPSRRRGSAVSDGECRSVTVSVCVSWNSSWRTAYLRSSRTEGSVKSSRVERSAPRSSPTTLSPALVSSRARMLPVNPTPMQTASTSLSIVAIVVSPPTLGVINRANSVFHAQFVRPPWSSASGISAMLLSSVDKRIGAQDRKIGKLAGLERTLLVFVKGQIGAVRRGTAQRVSPAERLARARLRSLVW